MNKWIVAMMLVLPGVSQAGNIFEGTYENKSRTYETDLIEFDGSVTMNTTSFYANGAQVNWFFEFKMPKNHDVQVGETVKGRVRSVDGLYGCVFDEKAEMKMEKDGVVKIRFPLLTYHFETRSVTERVGTGYRRYVDWTGWGWVERGYHFPIERYRIISQECVVTQRNNTVNVLYPLFDGGHNPPVPAP
ncbi:hypothetical protein ACLSU7_13770 [Bdellovibrio sp. HCB185ZH]|uniref:hypothetical protein n=1 Tax=Bdellovibrio sp. HCB185ZH TaxID=3394235 RepID=UPI0039A6BDA3